MKNLIILLFLPVCIYATEKQVSPNQENAKRFNLNKMNVGVVFTSIPKHVDAKQKWQNFTVNYPDWNAEFNPINSMPAVALGKGIVLKTGNTIEAKVMSFIKTELKDFVDVSQLNLVANNNNGKQFLTYIQSYKGLPVLFSHLKFCLTQKDELVLFKSSFHPNISIGINATLSESQALMEAQKDFIGNVLNTETISGLKILPIVNENKLYEYKLVYEIYVETAPENGIPGYYYTLVDANNGEIWFRQNQVYSQVDVNLKSTLYPNGPLEQSDTFALPYLEITSGATYTTDVNGNVSLLGAFPLDTAIYSLRGTYARLRDDANGDITPSAKVALDSSVINRVKLDGLLDINNLTAYWAVNTVHDYMKSKLPSFTSLDFALKTNVNLTSNSCNAFYTAGAGQSINFYKAGGGCNNTAGLTDVVYHEYGHAINRNFYASQGATAMFNGALNEAYSDIWAMTITELPYLGKGMRSDPNFLIRQYNAEPKVYPVDLVGQVHADGEIIAGAWWDLGQNLGSIQQMMDLFIQAYYLTPDGADGNEGVLYRQILIDVLTVDDDNANLNDGTPNDSAIIAAFDRHGITLLSTVDIVHTEISASAADVTTNVLANITVDYPFYVEDYIFRYKTNYEPVWQEASMSATVNLNEFAVNLPVQPKGALMDYYIKVTTLGGGTAKTLPNNMELGIPNISYKAYFGYTVIQSEDFDNSANPWFLGDVFDDASSGIWEVGEPIASYVNPGTPIPEEMVQPEFDNSTAGLDLNQCAFTGNAFSSTLNPLVADVDGGKTTIFSPVFGIQNFTNPVFSYFRWFSNNLGTNPNQDKFESYITSDGINWVIVESTPTSDNTWRQNLVDIKKYIPVGGVAQMKFVVSDLGLASLVEGAVDDLVLYNFEYGVGIDEQTISSNNLLLYPNPASNNVSLFIDNYQGDISIRMFNQIGQLVYSERGTYLTNNSLSLQAFDIGMYFIEVELSDKSLLRKKLTITQY